MIRLDKIGDLICTLCVDQVSFLKDCEVKWTIAKGLSFIPDHSDPPRSYLELAKEDWKTSLKSLRTFLKDFKPDVAVSFQAPWWVSYALWKENIPVRAGVKSQWHSFLFLNKALRQRRSLATQHEADYNMDLLRYALNSTSSEPTPLLRLKAPRVPGLFEKYHLHAGQYIVVHPGMAGSALNWPVKNYIELIEKLLPGNQIVLTGTAGDEVWLSEIKKTYLNEPKVLSLQSKLTGPELLVILKNAKAVIVPSTGVAHIAAALGTTVLGLYSPVRVQHPTRWAARGEKVKIFMPEGQDPDQVNPACMQQIQPDDLLKALSFL